MLDWFPVAIGISAVVQLLGWCQLLTTVSVILAVTLLRYVLLPADCDAVLWLCERFGHRPEKFKGRVIWITGASSGIGAALAIRLAKAGARVVLSARSVDKLNQVKQKCIESGGVSDEEVLVLPLDMLHYDQHEAAFQAVLKQFGELDILVNNAGRSQRGRWEEIQLAVDREMFELDVFSTVALTRHVCKYFLKRGHGHIAVTSSAAGVCGVPLSGTYTAAKHALHGYFESLRTEKIGQGLFITMVCPGPVESNLDMVLFSEMAGETLGKLRMGKMMSAERCGELFAVALANRLSDAWIALQPALALMYIMQYMPFIAKIGMKLVPLSFLQKLRDGRVDMSSS